MPSKNIFRTREDINKKIRQLEKEVRKYFSTHNYGNGGKFELEKLELPDKNDSVAINRNLVHAVPKGIDEEIFQSDEKFERGLAQIGIKYGVYLAIPYYCYAK